MSVVRFRWGEGNIVIGKLLGKQRHRLAPAFSPLAGKGVSTPVGVDEFVVAAKPPDDFEDLAGGLRVFSRVTGELLSVDIAFDRPPEVMGSPVD